MVCDERNQLHAKLDVVMEANFTLEQGYNEAMSELTMYKKKSSQLEGKLMETSNGFEQLKSKYYIENSDNQMLIKDNDELRLMVQSQLRIIDDLKSTILRFEQIETHQYNQLKEAETTRLHHVN